MTDFLAACVVAGTPLVFATLGELITEKSGSTNLGVEGMMLIGAVMGFLAAMNTESPVVAILAAAVTGAAGALIYAILTVTLRANQIVCGLTLTIFGTGYAQFVGQPLLGMSAPSSVISFFGKISIPVLGDIPFIGPVFFQAGPVRIPQLHNVRAGSRVHVQDQDGDESQSPGRKQCGG